MKFLCDVMLGRLARRLRMLGFDTIYNRSFGEAQMLNKSRHQDRILLSRRTSLLKRKNLPQFCFIQDDDVSAQLAQVVRTFKIKAEALQPFSRCLACNIPLEEAADEQVACQVPEYVCRTQSRFSACPRCRKVYWPGTHLDRMRTLIDDVLKSD